MRLTTKGRFAVTAMIDLAFAQSDGPVSLAGISKRQQISLSYLEQLFSKLRRYQLVESIRGPGGGYILARESSEITVADIIIAVDEPMDTTACGSKKQCSTGKNGQHVGHCMTHNLWTQLNQKMMEFLESVSLQSLVDNEKSRRAKATVSVSKLDLTKENKPLLPDVLSSVIS